MEESTVKEEYNILETLEEMKKGYLKDVPPELADAMIRRLVYTLMSR